MMVSKTIMLGMVLGLLFCGNNVFGDTKNMSGNRSVKKISSDSERWELLWKYSKICSNPTFYDVSIYNGRDNILNCRDLSERIFERNSFYYMYQLVPMRYGDIKTIFQFGNDEIEFIESEGKIIRGEYTSQERIDYYFYFHDHEIDDDLDDVSVITIIVDRIMVEEANKRAVIDKNTSNEVDRYSNEIFHKLLPPLEISFGGPEERELLIADALKRYEDTLLEPPVICPYAQVIVLMEYPLKPKKALWSGDREHIQRWKEANYDLAKNKTDIAPYDWIEDDLPRLRSASTVSPYDPPPLVQYDDVDLETELEFMRMLEQYLFKNEANSNDEVINEEYPTQ